MAAGVFPVGIAYTGYGLSYARLDANGFIDMACMQQPCRLENPQNTAWETAISARAFEPEDESHWEGDTISPQRR
jgi:hypothetical protein